MNPRSVSILEAAIQEFIQTGEPVSSGWLYTKYDFGIKPAMIRLELDALEEQGYLEQPYHSAGRVPTDAGYEFFVERALEETVSGTLFRFSRMSVPKRVPDTASSFTNFLKERAWSDLLNEISSQLGLLSVVIDQMNDEVHKTGLEALVSHLNWQDPEGIRSVIHDFETFDERGPRAAEKMGDPSGQAGPQVFIGRKSPVTSSESLSVVCGNYNVDGVMVSIFAIGPKRMDYKRAIRIFKSL